jgi:hypothetical protein
MWLYSKITPLIYRGENPYITDDERKLDETELRMLKRAFPGGVCQYFNIWLGRFCPPDTWDTVAKVDRAVIRLLGPLGYVLAGRFILGCNVSKVE